MNMEEQLRKDAMEFAQSVSVSEASRVLVEEAYYVGAMRTAKKLNY